MVGRREGEVLRHLWGRMGILLQRGNAAILGNQVPAHPDAVPLSTNLFIVFRVNIKNVLEYSNFKNDGAENILTTGSLSSL